EARDMRKIVLLVHRQRVHVRAQPDRASAVLLYATNDADHPCLADVIMMLDVKTVQLARDDLCGPVLLEPELRMRVQVAPDRGQLDLLAAEVVDRGHELARRFSGRPRGARRAGAGRPRSTADRRSG